MKVQGDLLRGTKVALNILTQNDKAISSLSNCFGRHEATDLSIHLGSSLLLFTNLSFQVSSEVNVVIFPMWMWMAL